MHGEVACMSSMPGTEKAYAIGTGQFGAGQLLGSSVYAAARQSALQRQVLASLQPLGNKQLHAMVAVLDTSATPHSR